MYQGPCVLCKCVDINRRHAYKLESLSHTRKSEGFLVCHRPTFLPVVAPISMWSSKVGGADVFTIRASTFPPIDFSGKKVGKPSPKKWSLLILRSKLDGVWLRDVYVDMYRGMRCDDTHGELMDPEFISEGFLKVRVSTFFRQDPSWRSGVMRKKTSPCLIIVSPLLGPQPSRKKS